MFMIQRKLCIDTQNKKTSIKKILCCLHQDWQSRLKNTNQPYINYRKLTSNINRLEVQG